jgi:hypothetical protein
LLTLLTPLSSLDEVDAASVGWKAKNLGRLLKAGLPVPDGYVLHRDYLKRLLRANGVEETYNDLLSRPSVINRFVKLRTLVTQMKIPPDDMRVLETVMEELGGRLAVRSSAADEDTGRRSMAGLYASVLDVDSAEALEGAILECFASSLAFGVWQETQSFGQGIGVIIQRFVPFQWGGVAFSRDPLTGDANTVALNYGSGSIENIVSGRGDNIILRIDKNDGPPDSCPLAACAVKALVDYLRRTEEAWGCPIDMEWGIEDGNLWVVQARPISRAREEAWSGVIDADDDLACSNRSFGPLYSAHERWMNKRHLVRRVCRRLGLKVDRVVYASFPCGEDECREIVRAVSDQLTTPVLEIHDGEDNVSFRRERLEEVCREKTGGFTRPTILRIQELPRAESCGYASVDPDGNTYIESLRGALWGFRLNQQPSVYLLDKNGCCLRRDESTAGEFAVLDLDTGSYKVTAPKPPTVHSLPLDVLRRISEVARTLHKELGEIRLEWTICDGEVSVVDLSEESNPLVETRFHGQVLSNGYAEGVACVLDDTDALDSLFRDPHADIDIVPKDSFIEITNSELCRRLVSESLGGLERPIVVAEYPSRTLAVLTPYVSGFIFERGALLAHLPIILREKRIPAVVFPNAKEVFRTGDRVRLVGGSVRRISQ